ncbi:flagellar hook-length control protein FliK [Paenibacillus sp. CAA11]|uniref:flagellar hook-length control protein FliK n=1 Tax=Paenibacillus sp. CAA11 TaxID=1532905 RepID=UPI000D376483|nr:flagellar hook-length control protein FliK [Paenibacillus sp. CAA11]AWB44276.1 flagellar hook-length control protein FliK [Paenibacillus sp. CAA11]
MNIGPVVRSLMAGGQASDAKTLELRTGQVVRGVVLSVSDNGLEAVVEVQGVQLKAALETPLEKGQAMMMQVQPPNKDGLTVLKPLLAAPSAVVSEAGIAELLKNMGLEANAQNRELAKLMQSQGMPMTREQAQQLLQTLSGKAPEVPLAQWINAAAIAQQRGLPVTGESLAGLRQAIYGPPVHQLMANLEEQVSQLLTSTLESSGEAKPTAPAAQATPVAVQPPAADSKAGSAAVISGSGGGAPAQQASEALLNKLQNVLGQLRQELARAGGEQGAAASSQPAAAGQGSSAPLSGAVGQRGPTPTAAQPAAAGATSAAPVSGAAAGAAGEAGAAPSPQGQAQPTPATDSWVGRVLKLLGVEHEQQTARALVLGARNAAQPAPSAAEQSTAPAPQQAAGTGDAPARNVVGGQSGGAAEAPPQAAPTAAAAASGQPHRSPAAVPGTADAGRAAVLAAFDPDAAAAKPDSISSAVRDTLKSILLQVMDSPDTPAPLQDAARQMVQQLTGQQLLLNTDRTMPFAQVTMFIPFKGPGGEETATVQIQSRRGRKGELDPNNCRLWFDLKMSSLGQVMVDVQVADRKVLLNLHSEREAVGQFLESRQEEIAEAIQNAGYRLVALKTESIPVESQASAGSESSLSFVPPSYQGVDYRV